MLTCTYHKWDEQEKMFGRHLDTFSKLNFFLSFCLRPVLSRLWRGLRLFNDTLHEIDQWRCINIHELAVRSDWSDWLLTHLCLAPPTRVNLAPREDVTGFFGSAITTLRPSPSSRSPLYALRHFRRQ